ncbi:MAG: hypothetical protein ACYTFK_12600 [Planctomycetota bacterium]|jgi:hypothetical protein
MTTNTQFAEIMQSNLFRLDGKEINLQEALQNLCECIDNDPMETNWELGESMDCSLDSLIVGAYWALAECHEGQYSDSYATLCALGTIFSPGMSCAPEDDDNGKTAYDLICDYLLKKGA